MNSVKYRPVNNTLVENRKIEIKNPPINPNNPNNKKYENIICILK